MRKVSIKEKPDVVDSTSERLLSKHDELISEKQNSIANQPHRNSNKSDLSINQDLDNSDEEDQHLQVPGQHPAKIADLEDPEVHLDQTNMISIIKQADWKPPKNISYETIQLTTSSLNQNVRPAGFRPNGKPRQIKNTCLLSKIKTRCRLRKSKPKMCLCITMYNEDENELRYTLSGLIHNYNTMKITGDKGKPQQKVETSFAESLDGSGVGNNENNEDKTMRTVKDDSDEDAPHDPNAKFTKDDFLVFVVVDGYERIPESFKKFAREKNFLDEKVLIQKGFLTKDKEGNLTMKKMEDLMDKGVKKENTPTNILHMFQVTSWDFGIDEDILKGRRINFIFAIKQRNDGKINSHKWFFQGICKYLKPDYCALFDIGTRADHYAIQKLYNHMEAKSDCGGCAGEIAVDMASQGCFTGASYFINVAQFYEYKLGHTPDKACESFYGFTAVLPGAYSLFRWKAIKGGPLDKFFKNVTREGLPTCSEANEYLAEDRIMCLQTYIKEDSRYTLSYVPDAIAYTDAPGSLMVLMKQRRRWMNGALFGTAQVIQNFSNVLSCTRHNQPWYRTLGMTVYMTYLVILYGFQFFLVGAMFTTILLFYNQIAALLLTKTGIPLFSQIYYDGWIYLLIQYGFLGMIFVTVICSLALPIDRAMPYFKLVSTMLSLMMLCTIVGVCYFLAASGFYPPMLRYEETGEDPLTKEPIKSWVEVPDESYFSWLVFAGVITFSVYLMPMIMRPLDFLSNFSNYLVGFLTYLVMLPVFTVVFQTYAMCNLHDVSWGNRPASTGQEAFTQVKKEQEQSKNDYLVFRTNFVFFWMISNMSYFLITIELINTSGNTETQNDGTWNYLNVFALIISGLILFRLVSAFGFLIVWKFRQWCCCRSFRKWQVKKVNLNAEFKKIRRDVNLAESSDEDEVNEELGKLFKENAHEISMMTGVTPSENPMAQSNRMLMSNRLMADAALEFAQNNTMAAGDSDDDQLEFDDAYQEEAEDRIRDLHFSTGARLTKIDVQRISRRVTIDEVSRVLVAEVTKEPKRGILKNSMTTAAMQQAFDEAEQVEAHANAKRLMKEQQALKSPGSQKKGVFGAMAASADQQDGVKPIRKISGGSGGGSFGQKGVRPASPARQSYDANLLSGAVTLDQIEEEDAKQENSIVDSSKSDMRHSKESKTSNASGGNLAAMFKQTDAEIKK